MAKNPLPKTASAKKTTRTVRSAQKISSASPVQLRRDIPVLVRMRLAAASGGRCEFPGCHAYLFAHHVTLTEGNFAEAAHIVGFKEAGPRGRGLRPNRSEINAFDNLMLLCARCHKLIDDDPGSYSVSLLRSYKTEHERRIHELTEIGPELKTTIIQLRGTIAGQQVDIPAPDVRLAIAPRYAANRTGHVIDLRGISAETPQFFATAQEQIRKDLRTYLSGGIDGPRVQHFSIFALAPIPVLICFGRELGDKVSSELYQRHRDTQDWKWKENGDPVEFEFHQLQQGTDPTCVGLLLSLSGRIPHSSIPNEIDTRFSLYELTLKGQEPSREFLRQRVDLLCFRRVYREALATILNHHDRLRELHLFPAVPAPVAIACGQELLPKVHPDLLVYDYVKETFKHAITINTGGTL